MIHTATKRAAVRLKGTTGEFEVIFATKKDANGELVIDLDGDVYGDDVVGQQDIIIGCWNHGDSCPGPAGVGKTVESDIDIRAAGRLLLETEHGRDEYARWKALGDQAEFSYLYRILDADFGTVNGRDVRRLLKLEVVSVDQVMRGAAGPGNTGIVDLKGACACGCGGDCNHRELTEDEKAELLGIRDKVVLIRERVTFQAFDLKQQASSLRRQLFDERKRFIELRESFKHRYVEVDDAPVPNRNAAGWAADFGAKQLGLQPVTVKFFRLDPKAECPAFKTDEAVWGRAMPNSTPSEIWLYADLPSSREVALVTFHELQHLALPHASETDVDEGARSMLAGVNVQKSVNDWLYPARLDPRKWAPRV